MTISNRRYSRSNPLECESYNLGGSSLHCGIVALVGCANVGKSSLMNRVLEDKVSIVSDVAQTTRNCVRGIYNDVRGQLVFLDTPGVHKATYDLGRLMNRSARASIYGSDVAMLVLDPATPVWEEDEGWMRKLLRADIGHLVFALNKQDLKCAYASDYRRCWARVCEEEGRTRPAVWMPVSAHTGDGVEALLDVLFDAVPPGPVLFPEDMLTDFPRKIAIADVIREKFFRVLRDEIPHDLAVRVKALVEQGAHWAVDADVLVNRPSQKGIVIGHKGRLIRKAKRQAEAELKAMYERDVELNLWVKVEKGWTKNHWVLKQLGYVGY